MKKSVLLVLVLLLSVHMLLGSESGDLATTGKKIFRKPTAMPILQTHDMYSKTPKGNRHAKGLLDRWRVYSDRADNATYNSFSNPNENSKHAVLGYMEPCWVIDESPDGEYVHIIKYVLDAVDESNNAVLEGADEAGYNLGWIEKSKLLLWNKSLRQQETEHTIKALMVNQVESLRQPEKYVNEDRTVKIYKEPGLQTLSEHKIKLYQFLYIYKQEGKSYLLGASENLRHHDVENTMIGWVSTSIVQTWDNVMALEPNWDAAAAAERERSGINCMLLSEQGDAIKLKEGIKQFPEDHILWNDDHFSERMDPQWKRLPIIDNDRGVIKTGAVTPIMDGSGTVVIGADEQHKLEREKSRVLQKLSNINLVFVIDGSASMRPHFEPVIEAVKRISGSIKQGESFNLKVGAIVYRDYPEERFNRLVQLRPLTSSTNSLVNFLDTISCIDKADTDKPEALFFGMNEAFKMISNFKDETNIVVVIGDTGNRRTRDNPDKYGLTSDKVINAATAVEAHILAFQVKSYSSEPSYEGFRTQINKILKVTSDNIINKPVVQEYCRKTGRVLQPAKWQLQHSTDYDFQYLNSDSPIQGSLLNPKPNKTLDANILQREVENLVEKVRFELSSDIGAIEALITGQGKTTNMKASINVYLASFDVDPSLLVKKSYDNYQFFVRAYTAYEMEGLQHPLYKYVLLLHKQELMELILQFDKLCNEDLQLNELRKHLAKSFNDLLLANLGKREYEDALKKDELFLHKYSSRIPIQSILLKDYKVTDLLEANVFKERDLITLSDEFCSCKDRLSAINDNRELEMKSGVGNTYYWVAAEIFP